MNDGTAILIAAGSGVGLGLLLAWLLWRKGASEEDNKLVATARAAADAEVDPDRKAALMAAAEDLEHWSAWEIGSAVFAGLGAAIVGGAAMVALHAGYAAVIAVGGLAGVAVVVAILYFIRQHDRAKLEDLLNHAVPAAEQKPIELPKQQGRQIDKRLRIEGMSEKKQDKLI